MLLLGLWLRVWQVVWTQCVLSGRQWCGHSVTEGSVIWRCTLFEQHIIMARLKYWGKAPLWHNIIWIKRRSSKSSAVVKKDMWISEYIHKYGCNSWSVSLFLLNLLNSTVALVKYILYLWLKLIKNMSDINNSVLCTG